MKFTTKITLEITLESDTESWSSLGDLSPQQCVEHMEQQYNEGELTTEDLLSQALNVDSSFELVSDDDD